MPVTHRITTPEPGHNGDVGAVTFRGGVAEIDAEVHAAELRYFRHNGYGVQELGERVDKPPVGAPPPNGPEPLPRPPASASKETWVAYVIQETNTPDADLDALRADLEKLTKAELIDLYGKEDTK
jgi:hypothetical protein